MPDTREHTEDQSDEQVDLVGLMSMVVELTRRLGGDVTVTQPELRRCLRVLDEAQWERIGDDYRVCTQKCFVESVCPRR